MTLEELQALPMYNDPPPNCPLKTWHSINEKLYLDEPKKLEDVLVRLPRKYAGKLIYFDKALC